MFKQKLTLCFALAMLTAGSVSAADVEVLHW